MKKYFLILIAVILSSCSSSFLDVDPVGDLYPETFYKTADQLDMAVTTLYYHLKRNTSYFWNFAPCFAGVDKTSSYSTFMPIDVFNADGSNAELLYNWSTAYAGINSANEIILRVADADITDAYKIECEGQARFLRAFFYFQLVRQYKELPFYTDNNDSKNEMEMTDSPEIYEQIIEDLKIAEDYLPTNWNSDTRKDNRIGWTNGCAKTLLSYVYLCEAGYPVKADGAYELAAVKAKDVIDNKNTWGYKLMENIADYYSADYNWEDMVCDEAIWAAGRSTDCGCPLGAMPPEYGGKNFMFADINFFESFPEGPRKDAIFMSKFPMEDGTVKDYTELIEGHPYFKQYWDGGNLDWDKLWESTNWKYSRPSIIMRYSDVLLIYAEAQARTSTPNSQAYAAVNEVRNRAGLPDLTTGLNSADFCDSVVYERSLELCGRNFNTDPWYDLLRLEKVQESIDSRGPNENKIVNTITERRLFMPYPDGDVLVNTDMDWGTW